MTVQSLFTHLVLDAAPLFQANSLPATISEHFYTVPEVISEIKDEASRAGLARLPYEVKVKNPSPEALKLVQAFAMATGDAAVLSPTDIRVIALTVTLELESNGEASKLQRTPRLAKIHQGGGASKVVVAGGDKPKQPRRKKGGQEVTSFDEEEPVEAKAEEVLEEAEEDDDAGEWITPDNIQKVKGAQGQSWQIQTVKPTGSSHVQVACVTSDFAMQNVLLQMRLRLYSPDGFRVKRLKNWLLRCHACYETTKQMDRKFCPKCGGSTLIRTSYSVDASGQMTLHLRSDFQYNNRGTKYSIPMPKGGRNNQDLMLREDQLEYQRAVKNWQRQQNKAAKGVSLDVIDDRLSSVFGQMSLKADGAAKAYFDGVAPPTIGFGRRNPNQVRRSKK